MRYRKMKWAFWLGLLLCFIQSTHAAPLAASNAFRPSLMRIDAKTLAVHFEIAPGYYLYRQHFVFPSDMRIDYPTGGRADPVLGKEEVYFDQIAITAHTNKEWAEDAPLNIRFQGCSEAGICYPPQNVVLHLGQIGTRSSVDQLFAPSQPVLEPAPAIAAPAKPLETPPSWGWFFLAGLGMAFTACMYPLIPIVSSIVVGKNRGGRWHSLGLTFTYIQGMAISYTLAGIMAAATGSLLIVMLQQTWMIVLLTLFFVLMALASWGIFELQFSSAMQTRLHALSNRLPGGHYASVLVMGMLSALIIGPCITPPLAAALAYLGKTGDVVQGGGNLFAMAQGMGLPLLLIGVFGSTVLPKLSPRFFAGVKILLGIALLGMAVWTARPLWQSQQQSALAFRSVDSSHELRALLPSQAGKPVLLDFYADWCVSCKELERDVLSQPEIQKELEKFTLLRADVTGNTPEQQALMLELQVFGPPTLLFFDRKGQRISTASINGKPDAKQFLQLLQQMSTAH